MEYIVSNILIKGEYRISTRQIEGKEIFQGHKLAIPDYLLPHILFYTHEKFRNQYYFLDYTKWRELYNYETLNNKMTDCWFSDKNIKSSLMRSYQTLLDTLEKEFGTFRKIYITQI
jgi:hypothetical protein